MSVLTFDLYASTKRDRSMREVGERERCLNERRDFHLIPRIHFTAVE